MVYNGLIIWWFLAALVAVAAMTMWLSAMYWRDRMNHNDDLQRMKMMEMRFGMDKERVVNDMQKQKALNRAELAYNVMHDVQAVHQGVDGYLRMMMDPTLTPPPEDWNMMCREVKLKSNLLRDLVDSAIELMQYENLADVPMEDDVLVNEFCKDMFAACERYLKNPNLELMFETSLADDYKVKTNMGYLRKLIKDLLVCAMEYTREGYIKMLVTEDDSRHLLHFMIKDTGVGMPKDVQKTVFEHLPNAENMCDKITGIRLRRCRALSHLLGGTIYIDTNNHEGTAIVFSIKS